MAELGESPLWVAGVGLRWLDVAGCRLFTLVLDGTETSVALSGAVTAIEPGPGAVLAAVTRSGFGTLDPATGRVEELVRTVHDETITMNDGAVDAGGALWAGSAVRDASGRGALFRFDGTEVTTQLTGLGMSNGLDWSPSGEVLYHVDTGAGTLTAWDCDVSSGGLGAGRVVCSLPAADGLPDGLTVDADGDIWLAIWGRGEVWRIDPGTGETTGIVRVPTRYPTSCVFGGDDLSTLYITSAAHDNAPGGGLVYAVDVPARGRLPHRFTGDPR
ncbi:SMP-30/gluconolactonase/LRE family protein [Haloechinothrix salitolerans]|uniref:SMP-30/gluconolactonase/LRE family protein n=2 Tax=Haloechinothrix salitolerans TaxID=926830 RepID=A0ABW2C066_9PSEU